MSSLCTAKAIREYFLEGKLPENGLFCPTDEVLFPPKDDEGSALWVGESSTAYSEEDLKLLETMRELGKELEAFVGTFKRSRSLLL